MKLPITIIEKNGEQSTYSSVQDAERSMEPVDVQNGEYLAQDADGRNLSIHVVEEPMPILFGFLKARVKKARIEES